MSRSKRSQPPKKESKKKGDSAQKSSQGSTQPSSQSPDPEQVVKEIHEMPREKQEMVQEQVFSGPIPPASELKAYEEVIEGAADRIIKMAEDEAEHRRKQETRVVESSCGDSRRGLWFGFIIGLAALSVSGIMAVFASPVTGGIIAFTSIASLVSVFVYGSKQKRPPSPKKENQQ